MNAINAISSVDRNQSNWSKISSTAHLAVCSYCIGMSFAHQGTKRWGREAFFAYFRGTPVAATNLAVLINRHSLLNTMFSKLLT